MTTAERTRTSDLIRQLRSLASEIEAGRFSPARVAQLILEWTDDLDEALFLESIPAGAREPDVCQMRRSEPDAPPGGGTAPRGS
jgi:hypothetical protein